MESPNSPEVIQAKGGSPEIIDAQVSPEIWKDLLHTAIVGNGIFPQSYFAQGILLANRMANLVNERKISLDKLQEGNPTSILISTMLGEAKNKSHSAHGFKTFPRMTGGDIISVWASDKNHAQDTLMSFAEVIHGPDLDISQQNKDSLAVKQQILHKVFSNPQDLSLLQEMLGVARQSLLSLGVKGTSNSYKEKIREFMQKYSKYDFSYIPDGYNEERRMLMEMLNEMLKGVTSSMKDELVSHLKEQRPQDNALLERMKDSDPDKLFGGVSVYNIHPLRHPDYE